MMTQTPNSAVSAMAQVPMAHFCLCDFHVHSPASLDVRTSRLKDVSADEREKIKIVDNGATRDAVTYENAILNAFPVGDYYTLLLERRDEIAKRHGLSGNDNWAVVGITDHNVCKYAASLSQHAWEQVSRNHLIVMPGIELDVNFPVPGEESSVSAHILCLYAPTTGDSDIRIAVSRAIGGGTWTPGAGVTLSALPSFIQNIRRDPDYPAICIAAHIATTKGVREEAKNLIFSNLDAEIARIEGELKQPDADVAMLSERLQLLKVRRDADDEISIKVLELIGSCGCDALQVGKKQDEIHYRRLHRFAREYGRAVPIVCSDAHCVKAVFDCDGETPFLKVSNRFTPQEIFEELRDRGLRFGETRFAYASPGAVRCWVAGVEIRPDAEDSTHFWPFVETSAGQCADNEREPSSFTMSFSRNLNCLIGGRGSGKSSLLEAIGFVLNPKEYDWDGKKFENRPDWYKTAQATIAGCDVRLRWQFQGLKSDGTWHKPICASRYFDSSGKHPVVHWTNTDGTELSQTEIPDGCEVQLFRVHEIEEAAKPQQLRKLFDQICGPAIVQLEQDIQNTLTALQENRRSMVELATQVRSVTLDDAPLREYCCRRLEYDAVNRPEVQQKYQAVDHAGTAVNTAKRTQSSWNGLTAKLPLVTIAEEIRGFLKATAGASLDPASGEPKPYFGPILSGMQLHKTEQGNLESGLINDVLAAIMSLGNALQRVEGGLASAVNETQEAYKSASEALALAGLPPGSGERMVKKAAFEEAERALLRYRELTVQWQALFQTRQSYFAALKETCVQRTQLRRNTADKLTSQLRMDLDESILIIELDAQPLADRTHFAKWLQTNLSPHIPKNKQQRVDALVKKGLSPEDLRNLLLECEGVTSDILSVDAISAADGKISVEDAEAYALNCLAMMRAAPEDAIQNMSEDQVCSLPQEVREGLWTFMPVVGNEEQLKVNAVLQLDEVILEDMPEIRLNDRPGETKSKARPLGELSPGQRCSAILPILLLNGTCPLIIDQPEDNLDNRLIRQVIVNILASMKMRRQVIVATHNPNLPVLGDVEQAVILRAVEEKACSLEACGNLDEGPVVRYITDIMEGGREAFQYRHSIYAAHWKGPVAVDNE